MLAESVYVEPLDTEACCTVNFAGMKALTPVFHHSEESPRLSILCYQHVLVFHSSTAPCKWSPTRLCHTVAKCQAQRRHLILMPVSFLGFPRLFIWRRRQQLTSYQLREADCYLGKIHYSLCDQAFCSSFLLTSVSLEFSLLCSDFFFTSITIIANIYVILAMPLGLFLHMHV